MNDTFEYANAAIQNILDDLQEEIRDIADVYDSKDLFGIAYGKFAQLIINRIEEKKPRQ